MNNSWGGKRAGAGRKATGKKTVTLSLTLTRDEAKELKLLADSKGLTISRFICQKLYLKR